MEKNNKGYCYLESDYNQPKCKEPCEACSEYERMLENEAKELDRIHDDLSTDLNPNSVFKMLFSRLEKDIKKATESYSQNENERIAFDAGIKWLFNTLKELNSLSGQKWTDNT